MPNKDPAFLFYSNDFLTGTLTMSHEDRGKFIYLLCIMHQQGRQDEETIRFLVGSVSDKLRLKFKTDESGMWYNERLESEVEKRSNFIESRKINGKLGGRPKASGKPSAYPSGKPNGKARHNLPEDVNEIENYFTENGYSIEAAKKFFKYYSEADWKDSKGNKVKNWKQKAQAVWFKDENKIQQRKGTWVDENGKVHSDEKLTL